MKFENILQEQIFIPRNSHTIKKLSYLYDEHGIGSAYWEKGNTYWPIS